MIEVVNLSKYDTIGRRFNNLDASKRLADYGISSKNICWESEAENSEIVQRAHDGIGRKIAPFLTKMSRKTGYINGYYRNSKLITNLEFYKKADLLHFHIVHDQYLSPRDWVKIAKNKALVWTWHDPFMLNGHCIYSMGCIGYQTGCQSCDHLDYHYQVERDRGAKNLTEKLRVVQELDPLVIVASDHMYEMVKQSVYWGKVRIKKLPFGIEFADGISQLEAKKLLNIPKENVVIGFRASISVYKNLNLIIDALKRIAFDHPSLTLTIITFETEGKCSSFSDNFQVIDLGWVDGAEIANYYSAMDYFLMPSMQEAFGLMAIEALAAGAMPIVTYGTALPDLIGMPEHGKAIEASVDSLVLTLKDSILNAKANAKKRDARIEFAKKTYGLESFSKSLANIYHEELSSFNSR
jgi:glycosyltransferase involved in cell wall biosynthesis